LLVGEIIKFDYKNFITILYKDIIKIIIKYNYELFLYLTILVFLLFYFSENKNNVLRINNLNWQIEFLIKEINLLQSDKITIEKNIIKLENIHIDLKLEMEEIQKKINSIQSIQSILSIQFQRLEYEKKENINKPLCSCNKYYKTRNTHLSTKNFEKKSSNNFLNDEEDHINRYIWSGLNFEQSEDEQSEDEQSEDEQSEDEQSEDEQSEDEPNDPEWFPGME
jgi:hypothetical protein